jgi:hypothetical protein
MVGRNTIVTWLRRDSVTVAWGLTGDEDTHGLGASIHCLMLLAGGGLESFTGVNDDVVMLYFEGEYSFEHEEELACVNMGVANLAGARRHELFDDAEFGSFDEVPAVAVGALWASPFVVFGRFWADDLCGHVSPPEGGKLWG